MNCEQVEERLSAYLDDMLTLEERREIAVHLQACSHCTVSLAELRQNDLLLAQLPRVSPRSALHERLFSCPEMLQLTDTGQSKQATLARRDSRSSLVALPGGRPVGLYRCTQRHSTSNIQRRITGCSKLPFLNNH